MKAKILTLFSLLLLCGLAMFYDLWQTPRVPDAAPVTLIHDEVAPDFSFQAMDGRFYRLKTLPEKGIVLHFWASWCAPCIAEFPVLLQRIQQAHGGLALVAVSIDDDRDAMNRFIARQNFAGSHLYWVWDGNKDISLKIFNTSEAPETILINTRRQMIDKIVGDPGWNEDKQGALLKSLADGGGQ